MAAVKQEPSQPTDTTENTRNSRASSVATMMDIPIRASSVVSRSAPRTPADAHITTADDDDVAMAETNSAQPPLDAMEQLGKRSRAVIQVIQKLAALNINTTLKSLPKIVVIGDQSAGKSSVIEALCDIQLPRSEGTCTRCPFQLTTTSTVTGSSPWTCHVSLQTQFVYLPKQTSRTTRNEKYARWEEQAETTTSPFATIYEKEDLGIALRRAQLAILNPQNDYRKYPNMSIEKMEAEGKNKVAFSPNVVCLEIAGANLPELSFYDLPGAINSTSDEDDEYLVIFVETLIKNYIGDSKTIVLLACAANQDVETATAIRFLRTCKTTDEGKARDRAMGILTKPDLVDNNPGKIAGINRILSGQDYVMGHGWFVTKQLAEKEMQQEISHQRARELEADFFTSGPWANELASHRGRFTTTNLQDALSLLLTKHILSELPGILGRVEQQLAHVDRQLATFPVEKASPSIAIMQEIEKLKTVIVSQLNADAISKFRTKTKQAFRGLKKDLKECEPKVAVETPGYVKKSISIDSSEEEDSPSKKGKPNDTRTLSATPRRTPAPAPSSSGREKMSDRKRKIPIHDIAVARTASRVTFNLEEVKRKFDSAPGADLGGSSNMVTKELVLDTMCGWASVANNTLKTIDRDFSEMLSGSLASALASRQSTMLFTKASDIVRALFRKLMEELTASTNRLIARELYRPITYSSQLSEKKEYFEAKLRKLRLKQRAKEYFEDLEAKTMKYPNEEAIRKKLEDEVWIAQTLGNDEFSREIKELAMPFAYHDLASTQLCDNIAKDVDFYLFHAYEDQVYRKLCEDLRTTDDAYCAHLLVENPHRERQRVALLEEKSKLEQARTELESLGLQGTHS